MILAALQKHQARQDEAHARLNEIVDNMVRATIGAERAAIEAKESAKESSRDSLASRAATERVEKLLNRPINKIVSTYQSHVSSTPPAAPSAQDLSPAVIFGKDEVGEITRNQDIRTIYHRAKEAEAQRIKLVAEIAAAEEHATLLAEKAKTLAAEAELHRLQALESERLAKVAEADRDCLERENVLKFSKMKAEAERANLVNKAIGAGVSLLVSATAFLTWYVSSH